MGYPRLASFKTAHALRTHLRSLHIRLDLDDALPPPERLALARPIEVDGVRVGNRFCILPMEGWDGTAEGAPGDLTRRRWRHFGISGAKLIWGGEAIAALRTEWEELDALAYDFVEAARLAWDAGFAFVDIKACHGYLGHELLSARDRAWSLAAFRTTSFMATMVVWLHVRGTLGAFLERLDTSIGLAIFIAFWVGTWVATRVGLRMAERDNADDRNSPASAVPATIVAGGWNGVFVFVILTMTVLATCTRAQGPVTAIRIVPVLFLVLVIGGLLAFTIGGVVGLVYGVVDTGVGLIGRALPRWVGVRTTGDSPRS